MTRRWRPRGLRRRGHRCVWCNDWTIRCIGDHLALCHYCAPLARRTPGPAHPWPGARPSTRAAAGASSGSAPDAIQ